MKTSEKIITKYGHIAHWAINHPVYLRGKLLEELSEKLVLIQGKGHWRYLYWPCWRAGTGVHRAETRSGGQRRPVAGRHGHQPVPVLVIGPWWYPGLTVEEALSGLSIAVLGCLGLARERGRADRRRGRSPLPLRGGRQSTCTTTSMSLVRPPSSARPRSTYSPG